MTRKSAVVAIAKNEAAYLHEWIAHHLFFGFEEFHIWINDTSDNSRDILRKIQKYFDCVHIHEGDELLRLSKQNNQSFQLAAYNQTLKLLHGGAVTHLMCLDIDEYWTPHCLSRNIEYFIEKACGDVIAFQWHLDDASHDATPFSPPLSSTLRLQRDIHVKSIAKIESIYACDVHTYFSSSAEYVLQDGSPFPSLKPGHFSQVSYEHQARRVGTVDEAFVLHRMNRSALEYTAALLRGRGYAHDATPLKTNRPGFVNVSARVIPPDFKVDALAKYQDFIADFASMCGLHDDLLLARASVVDRATQAIDLVRSSPFMFKRFRQAFNGINLADITAPPAFTKQPRSHIDTVTMGENGGVISGWAFIEDSEISPPAVLVRGRPVDYEMQIVPRSDVQVAFNLPDVWCGFTISFRSAGSPNEVEVYF